MVVALLVLLAIPAAAWHWLVWRGLGSRTLVGLIPANLTLVAFLRLWVTWPDYSDQVIVFLMVPPLILWDLHFFFARFWGFVAPLLMPSLVVGIVVLAIFRRLRQTRLIAMSLALVAATGIFLVLAERRSVAVMCDSARAVGLTGIQRQSYLHSMKSAGDGFASESHAVARRGTQVFEFSYRDMAWHERHVTLFRDDDADVARCDAGA